MKNTGVIIKKPRKEDYRFGAETGVAYEEINPSGDWKLYLPTEERQKSKLFDTMACVTFSALNCIETQVNFLIKSGKIGSENLKKLKDWGFIDQNGFFNCSDRFTAKVSGTTNAGNTLVNVWDSIRKQSDGSGFGLVPESLWNWDMESQFYWNEYYKDIPQDIIDFGKKIWEIFDFQYEWVFTGQCGNPPLDLIKTNLKQAPLQIASPTCPTWNTGIVSPCGTCKSSHATMICGVDEDYIKDFDHYVPFLKNLELNYTIPYCLKGVVKVKQTVVNPNPVDFLHEFKLNICYGERSDEVKWLQGALKTLKNPNTNEPFFKVLETGYYGDITRQAVLDFQVAYNFITWYERYVLRGKLVGQKTRSKLNELLNV